MKAAETFQLAKTHAHQLSFEIEQGEKNLMFFILLTFSDNQDQADQFMEGHKKWIERGFDDGLFLMVGNLQSNLGGGILAHNTSLSELKTRVINDPFVANNVVKAKIFEITPSKTNEKLRFLLN